MDKNEEEKRKIDEHNAATEMDNIRLPTAPEYVKSLNTLLSFMDRHGTKLFSDISKDRKSIFANKKTLNYMRQLASLSYTIAVKSIISYFASDYLNRKIELLEQAIGLMQRQFKDLPASEDVRKLREISARMTELDELMLHLKKMNDEQELEKTARLKARQELMKDLV